MVLVSINQITNLMKLQPYQQEKNHSPKKSREQMEFVGKKHNGQRKMFFIAYCSFLIFFLKERKDLLLFPILLNCLSLINSVKLFLLLEGSAVIPKSYLKSQNDVLGFH